MKEYPINLTDELVRAALEGRLTEIRVPLDPQPVEYDGMWMWGRSKTERCAWGAVTNPETPERFCQLGVPGDRLWGQEAWRSWEETCDDMSQEDDHVCSAHCQQTYVAYRATPRYGFRPLPDRARITYLDESSPIEWNPRLLGPWEPARTMPREFARLLFELADVRVERSAGAWEFVGAVRRLQP